MLARSILVLLSVIGSLSWASGLNANSARREPGVSYKAYKTHAFLLSQGQTLPTMTTPVEEAKAYGTVKSTLPAATAWVSEAEMNASFEKFRDYRFITTNSKPDFKRRISWLYPDDGCFARAALAILNLGSWNTAVPKKIFVFGDLTVQTKNSPSGSVTWWYHVAPLVEVDGVKYVLDPAINPKTPLKLEDWLATMSAQPDTLEVAICGSGSYTPYDNCARETDGREEQGLNDQPTYLEYEWSRLQDLGRNPENELGDLPPWL